VSLQVAWLSWWPWFLGSGFIAWFAGRVFLPEAWRHRHEDKGGLAFALCLLAIGLFNLWHMLRDLPAP
jgi:hypothetical protein